MANRKAIPKKTRFEVLKRDKFTCQYCGAKAPDVVLHIDHIKPVAHDGDNDIMNLVTACEECNLGKGARELSDDSAVVIKRNQAEALAERREQIGMMHEWQMGLIDEKAAQLDALDDICCNLTPYSFSDSGRKKLAKLIERFGFGAVIEAVRIAFTQYESDTPDDWDYAFGKIGGICYNKTHKSCSQCKNMTDHRYSDRTYLCDYHVLNTGHDDDPPIWHEGTVAEYCPDYESKFGGGNA